LPENSLDHFKSYSLVFTDLDTGTHTFTHNILPSELGDPIPLEDETNFSLVVYAYADASRTNLAADGSPASNIAVSGTGSTIAVSLTPKSTALTGTGTFAWDIDISAISATLSTHTMTITPLPTGTAIPIDLTTNATDEQTLPSGYYTVDILLANSTAGTSYTERQVLHIYDFLTTNFEPSAYTAGNLGTIVRAVTFQYNDSGAGSLSTGFTGPDTIRYVLNSTAVAPPPTNPSHPGFEFDDWYTAAALGTKYVFSTPVTGALTLYGKWVEEATTVNFDLDLDFEIEDLGDTITGVAATLTVYWNDSLGNARTTGYVFTVTNAASFDSVNWYIGSTAAGTGASSNALLPSNFGPGAGATSALTIVIVSGGKTYNLTVPVTIGLTPP
jgi:hypothetical protein